MENKTDLEKFIELYKSFGIEITKIIEDKDEKVIRIGTIVNYKEINKSEKFDGINFSYSNIIFTKEGKFISQGFWE